MLFLYHIIYIPIHTTTCIYIYIYLNSYIETSFWPGDFVSVDSTIKLRKKDRVATEVVATWANTKKDIFLEYISKFRTILPNLCMSLYESKKYPIVGFPNLAALFST